MMKKDISANLNQKCLILCCKILLNLLHNMSLTVLLPILGQVRYINIRAWLRGFRVKIANFSSFLCPSIPKRDLDTKKTTLNIEVWPDSLGAMLEYWYMYIEHGLLATYWVPDLPNIKGISGTHSIFIFANGTWYALSSKHINNC